MRISDWSSDVCSSDLSSAIASCATPASASSTPIDASASTPSRKLFMSDVLRFRNDDPIEEPAVTLDAFVYQEDASAVRIEAGEDPLRLIRLLDRVKLVELGVPRFRDGRCFTAARILREAGYEGEIRAEGDVLVDLIFFMRDRKSTRLNSSH